MPTGRKRASGSRKQRRSIDSHSISARTFRRVRDGLKAAGIKSPKALALALAIVKRLLHTLPTGARISEISNGERLFTSYERNMLTAVLKALYDANLLACDDWLSYYASGGSVSNVKARRFHPTYELLALDWIGPRAVSVANHEKRRYLRPPAETICLPFKGNASVPTIPDNVRQAFTRPSGLFLDANKATELFRALPTDERMKAIRNTTRAVGYAPGDGIIQLRANEWRQDEGGRVYATSPALHSLPRIARPALVGDVYNVDFEAMEPTLFLTLNGLVSGTPDTKTLYALMGDLVGQSGRDIKKGFLPLLHGQSSQQITWNDDIDDDERESRTSQRKWALAGFQRMFGKPFEDFYWSDKDKYFLQQQTAGIFLPALATAIDATGLPIGLPLHDGWIIQADKDTAHTVGRIFADTSERITGQRFNVAVQKVA